MRNLRETNAKEGISEDKGITRRMIRGITPELEVPTKQELLEKLGRSKTAMQRNQRMLALIEDALEDEVLRRIKPAPISTFILGWREEGKPASPSMIAGQIKAYLKIPRELTNIAEAKLMTTIEREMMKVCYETKSRGFRWLKQPKNKD